MKFVGQGIQTLQPEQDRQADRHALDRYMGLVSRLVSMIVGYGWLNMPYLPILP